MFTLDHSFKDFGPLLINQVSLYLWQGNLSWKKHIGEQHCSPHGQENEREEQKKDFGLHCPSTSTGLMTSTEPQNLTLYHFQVY